MLGVSIARKARVHDAARAAAVWLGTVFAGGLALDFTRPTALAGVAALGTLAVMSRRQWAFAVPLGAAVMLDPTMFPWAVAAAALTRDLGREFPAPTLGSEPQRQLMRSRRRNEPASVIVLQAEAACAAQLWSSLRATDGLDVVSRRDGIELRGVLAEDGLDRIAFEERLRRVVGASDVRLGWASFPADGVTLEVLVDAARTRLATSEAGAEVRLPEPGVAPQAVAAHAGSIAEG